MGAAFVAVRVPIVRPLMPAFVVVTLENFEAKDRCIIVQYLVRRIIVVELASDGYRHTLQRCLAHEIGEAERIVLVASEMRGVDGDASMRRWLPLTKALSTLKTFMAVRLGGRDS